MHSMCVLMSCLCLSASVYWTLSLSFSLSLFLSVYVFISLCGGADDDKAKKYRRRSSGPDTRIYESRPTEYIVSHILEDEVIAWIMHDPHNDLTTT
jgi:thiosulfate reductase cytochrome b subunit